MGRLHDPACGKNRPDANRAQAGKQKTYPLQNRDLQENKKSTRDQPAGTVTETQCLHKVFPLATLSMRVIIFQD